MEAIIAGVVSLIGALIGAGQDGQAAEVRRRIAAEYENFPLPVLDKLVAQKLPPDAAARYMKATQATQAQGDVLNKTMDVVNEQGETASDRAAYIRMRNQAAGIANSAQAPVDRAMAARGLSGSGMAFALKQGGAQSAANAANAAGVNEAADARSRYMDALGMAGQQSNTMRAQKFAAMQAQDSINEFNARQQSDADFRNQQLPQQDFDNRMLRQGAKANAQAGVASGYERGAESARQTAGGVGQSIITAGAAYRQSAGAKKKKGGGYANESGGQDWGDE